MSEKDLDDSFEEPIVIQQTGLSSMINFRPFPLTNQERFDRNSIPKAQSFSVGHIGTLRILLDSTETFVQIQVLYVLQKFLGESPGNVSQIIEENIFPQIVNLVITSSSLSVCRTSAMILLELSVKPAGFDELLKYDEEIPNLLQRFCETSDEIYRDLLSEIILNVSKSTLGCAKLLQRNVPGNFFEKVLLHSDDVTLNLLKVFIKFILCTHGGCNSLASKIPGFDLKGIFELLNHKEKLIVDQVFHLLLVLSRRPMEEPIEEQFVTEKGVIFCVDLLYNKSFFPYSQHTLNIVCNFCESPIVSDSIPVAAINTMLEYINSTTNISLISKGIIFLVKIGHNSKARLVLVDQDFLNLVIPCIQHSNSDLSTAGCEGVLIMASDESILPHVVSKNPIPDLIQVINDLSRTQQNLITAARTIQYLVDKSMTLRAALLLQGMDTIMKTLGASECPNDLLIILLNCVKMIADVDEMREKMMSRKLVHAIGHLIKPKPNAYYESLHLAALQALTFMLIDSESKFWLMEVPLIENEIVGWFMNERCSLPFIWQLACLLRSLVKEPLIAAIFVELEFVNWLQEHKEIRNACRALEAVCELLFDSDVSLKFNTRFQLSTLDITSNGFYVYQSLGHTKPTVKDMISLLASPLIPMYLIAWEPIGLESRASSETEKTLGRGSRQAGDLKSKRTGGKKVSAARSSSNNASLAIKPKEFIRDRHSSVLMKTLITLRRIPQDNELLAYLEEVNSKLTGFHATEIDCGAEGEEKKSMRPVEDNTRARIQALAEVTSKAMSGPDRNIRVTPVQVEVHVHDLKEQVQSSIIPIGCLRYGYKLERAILFKALADQIGILCALKRGRISPVAWVEVPILDELRPIYESNFIVDLMDDIGKLMIPGSPEAEEYCSN